MDANRDPRRIYYIHTDTLGHRVVYYGNANRIPNVNHISNANRIPNASAATSCAQRNLDCDVYAGGERCSLYAHCLARGIDRGHQRGTGG